MGEGAFLIKIYFGAFAGMFSDSPFPNIMRVVGRMAWFHCGIGLGVRWDAGNCGRLDSQWD
jgi:hypothetical protein